MKKAIIFLAVFFSIIFFVNAEIDHSYEISLHYNQGNLSLNYVTVILSTEAYRNGWGRDYAEIRSADGAVLNRTLFGIPTFMLVDYIDNETGEISGGGQFDITETDITLYAPYFANAKEIVIFDKDSKERFRFDVSQYSEKKLVESVPAVSDENISQPAVSAPSGPEKSSKTVYLLLVLIIFGIIVFILIRHKKKNT